MQASVEERLHSLELATEALSRRMDSFVGQRQIISHESPSHMLEQTNQQLSRARPRLQPIQNSPIRTGPSNTEASRPFGNEQTIIYYQHAQPSSTAVLNSPQVSDQTYSARPVYNQRTVYPQGPFVAGPNAPAYYQDVLDNKWQCRSCCLFWWGLMALLGGIAMATFGTIYLLKYLALFCQSQQTKIGNQCCSVANQYKCSTSQYASLFSFSIAFICCGFVLGVIGICFLAKAYNFYKHNSSTCC